MTRQVQFFFVMFLAFSFQIISFLRYSFILVISACSLVFFECCTTFLSQFSHNSFRCILLFLFVNASGLTLSWRRSSSYRNQSIDLGCKSINWFLYDRGLRHKRVKGLMPYFLVLSLVVICLLPSRQLHIQS